MEKFLKVLSFAGLILSLLPAFLSFAGLISFEQFKILLVAGTVLWFSTAPAWINKKKTA